LDWLAAGSNFRQSDQRSCCSGFPTETEIRNHPTLYLKCFWVMGVTYLNHVILFLFKNFDVETNL
jgi:hypothetical protein